METENIAANATGQEGSSATMQEQSTQGGSVAAPAAAPDKPTDLDKDVLEDVETEPWPERFTAVLAPFLSEEVISQVKNLYLEGPEPPFVSDGGWGGRKAKVADTDIGEGSSALQSPAQELEPEKTERSKRGRDRGRGGRSGRGGRGGRTGRPGEREDHRKILSDVCTISLDFGQPQCHLIHSIV